MIIAFKSIKEDKPGEKWQQIFKKTWPYYKKWFLSQGYTSRKGYLTSATKLQEYMPEVMPIYEKFTELSGGGDLEARFLSMYCPPPYMTACSQIAWTKDSTSLIRNYDYNPQTFEGTIIYTNWLKKIIGISDCTWGLLDGMNEDGLALSLTFGGRKVVGEGFGIPLILRYILETSAGVKEAMQIFLRIPVHMSYNVTMIDKSGEYATVYLSPDRPPYVTRSQVGTNHQFEVEWEDYALLTATVERHQFLESCVKDPDETEASLIKKFLHKPLYSKDFNKSFGTLYTVIYRLDQLSAELRWPDKNLTCSFENFSEEKCFINLSSKLQGNLIK